MRHSRRWMRAGIVAGAAVAACKFTPGSPAGGPGDGKIAVNGGGGGAGAVTGGAQAGAGSLDRNPAPGVTSGGSPGGNGGAGNVLDGGTGSNQGGHGGGGGGGVGRIRFNTRNSAGLMIGSAAVLSPSLSDSPTTCSQGSAATN